MTLVVRLIRCRYCGDEAPAETPREAARWHLDHGCIAAGERPAANPIVVRYSVVTK